MKDSFVGDIFYTYSAYEMKNFLQESDEWMRILISPAETTEEGKAIYSAVSMSKDYVHMDMDGRLYSIGLLKPDESSGYRLYYCPKTSYKTPYEFKEEFENLYAFGTDTDRYYVTKYGYIMDEDSTDESIRFVIGIMKGERIW